MSGKKMNGLKHIQSNWIFCVAFIRGKGLRPLYGADKTLHKCGEKVSNEHKALLSMNMKNRFLNIATGKGNYLYISSTGLLSWH